MDEGTRGSDAPDAAPRGDGSRAAGSADDPSGLPIVGAHLRTGGGLHLVVERAEDIGAEAVQIFPTSPRRWKPHRYPDEQLDALRDGLGQAGLPLFVHSIYLINLASPDEDLRRQSAAALAHALAFGGRTAAAGVVTHVGSHKGDGFPVGLERVAEAVAETRELARQATGGAELPILLLEGSAGAPNSLGRTIEELGTLVGRLPGDVGICLDTAHLYAAGIPVHTAEGLDALLDDVDAALGLERLRLFHLNDARNPFGSGRDQHANLGHGELGDAGIRNVLTHPDLALVPFVMEVPGIDGHGPDAANMARARRLRAEERAS